MICKSCPLEADSEIGVCWNCMTLLMVEYQDVYRPFDTQQQKISRMRQAIGFLRSGISSADKAISGGDAVNE